MKKENYYKLMYVISIILVAGFAIRLGMDYHKYDFITMKAPFYTFIIERTLEFIIPSIIIFIVGVICKKKFTNNK